MKKKDYLEMKTLLNEFKEAKQELKPFNPHRAAKQFKFIYTIGFRILLKTKAPDETMEDIATKAFDLFIDVAFINKNKPVDQIVEGHLSDRYSINGMISGVKKVEFH
jgi:hypothetical protein